MIAYMHNHFYSLTYHLILLNIVCVVAFLCRRFRYVTPIFISSEIYGVQIIINEATSYDGQSS